MPQNTMVSAVDIFTPTCLAGLRDPFLLFIYLLQRKGKKTRGKEQEGWKRRENERKKKARWIDRMLDKERGGGSVQWRSGGRQN